jgi:glycerophosphoryl diester phosphodiesterase
MSLASRPAPSNGNSSQGQEGNLKLPLVIGHRGACGYRPENTMGSFRLAFKQGADGIEFDIVTTRDGALIIRHENALSSTTNIANVIQLAGLIRQGTIDNHAVTDWFTEDLQLEQLKLVRAVERLPDVRPGSAKFDGMFSIPQFQEILQAEFIAGKYVVAELKSGSHLDKLARPIWEVFGEQLEKTEISFNLVVESFDVEILRNTKAELAGRGIAASYFFLLEQAQSDSAETLLVDFDGLSISLEMLKSDPTWVSKVHDLGGQIWVYTARAEAADTSIEAYYEEIIQSGVDGIFADQPDLLRRVLQDSRGSAYDY